MPLAQHGLSFRPLGGLEALRMKLDGEKKLPDSTPAADAISGQLRERLGDHRYGMWFDQGTNLRVKGEEVEVEAASQFVADWIGRNFRGELESAARAALGDRAHVSFRVASGPNGRQRGHEDDGPALRARARLSQATGMTPVARLSAEPGADMDAAPARRAVTTSLRRLEEFVVGDANRVAFDAATRAGEAPLRDAPNLFLHGGCGLGKTHLLQGICQRRREKFPRERIRYTTGEQFTNEYIAAVRSGDLEPFRARVRKLDLLAIDDVHFLANKVATQAEFMHTLDALDRMGRVVLASDEHPRQIRRFNQALVSRFLAGVVVRVEPPDRVTRTKLTLRLAERRGLRLSTSAADAVAGMCVASVREIEGALAKLAAIQAVEGSSDCEVQAALVERLLRDERLATRAGPVRIGEVLTTVCGRLGVQQEELLKGGRHRRVVLGRGLVVYLARELTTLSFPEIARALGREGHSSALSADRRVRRLLDRDESANDVPDGPTSVRELVAQLRHGLMRMAGN